MHITFFIALQQNLKGSNRSQTLNDSQNDSVQLSFPFIKATVHNKFKHVTETKKSVTTGGHG